MVVAMGSTDPTSTSGTPPREPAPTVSLVMTVRNGERYLDEALASIEAQRFRDWELVLWDDGSRDATPSIIQAWAEREPRIRSFTGSGTGRRAALRRAHAEARGRFVGWVDADDELEPATLERTVDFLERHASCGMVYTDYEVIDANGENRRPGSRSKAPYHPHRLLTSFVTFHFRLVRREVFEQAGGIDPDLEVAIDYDLCLRLSERTQIRQIAEPLYVYRNHGEQMSVTRHDAQVEASREAVCRALVRRGLAGHYALEVENGRFSLRVIDSSNEPKRLRGLRRLRALLATLVAPLRPHVDSTRPPRSVSVWPRVEGDPYGRMLGAELAERGIDVRLLGAPLAALLRAVFTGRAGDRLLLYEAGELVDFDERGIALANLSVLRLSLAHAQARGIAIICICDVAKARSSRQPDLLERWQSTLARASRRIVVRHACDREAWIRALPETAERVVVSPHPNYESAFPVLGREAARSRLGLDESPRFTVLVVGEPVSTRGVEQLVGALEHLGRSKDTRVLIACERPPVDVKTALLNWSTRTTGVDLSLGIRGSHRTSALFSSADAVILAPGGTHSAQTLSLAMSFGKPIVAPSSIHHAVGDVTGAEAFVYHDAAETRDDDATGPLVEALRRLFDAGEKRVEIGFEGLKVVRDATWSRELDVITERI